MSITIEMFDSFPGSYMPKTGWLLYAGNAVAPLCRKRPGSFMPEVDWLLCAGRSHALRMAWFRRRPEAGVIVHSDRGSQYCSGLFQDTLKAYGMRSSMSRRGDCWDNAPTESLWGSLKVARVHGRHFTTRRAAMDEIVDWLGFYNARRLHSTLNYVSPMTFEKNWVAAQRGQAA
jgi:hypothetical protein